MCTHFESVKDPLRFTSHFKVSLPEHAKTDVWPTYLTSFIRLSEPVGESPTVLPGAEAVLGRFGLIPHWSKDVKIGRFTYNARIETVSSKPSFKDAWRMNRRCIIPVEAFYEPDWRSGKAVSTRIISTDGKPMGLAGIWTAWRGPDSQVLRSFSLLTLNADDHDLMRQFHKPNEEKSEVDPEFWTILGQQFKLCSIKGERYEQNKETGFTFGRI